MNDCVKEKEKGLSAHRLTMMAVGTVIGGSFFLGSSVAIHAAGPSILIAYALGGVLVYFILQALSEMTVENTHYGSFRAFASQAFGQGMGFVVGWVYWFGLVLGMSSEATAVSILVRTWLPNLPIAALGSAIIIGVTLLNLLGADKLSKLESSLASVKVIAVVAFIAIGLLLIFGLYPGAAPTGVGQAAKEPFMAGGLASLGGSMLVVMFAYSGFEIIGLAASEAREPKKTIPKAIMQTVMILVTLYVLSAAVLLPLIPTADISENVSPMVAALDRHGFGWAGTALNIVLVTAILSTMLASVFGMSRIFRSLADEGLAPPFLKDRQDIPYRSILFTGIAMLAGLGLGLLFPKVYLFLLSSGGFAILFTYAVIMASHIRFRMKKAAVLGEKYHGASFPVSSFFTLIGLLLSIVAMPFVPGQESGLIAGIIMVVFFSGAYALLRVYKKHHVPEKLEGGASGRNRISRLKTSYSAEISKDHDDDRGKDRNL